MGEAPKRRRPLFRALRTMLLGIAASTAAMLLSYAVVLVLMRETAPLDQATPSQQTLSDSAILDAAERLGALAERFSERIPPDSVGYTPEALSWVQRNFRTEIQVLQQDLAEPLLARHPAARVLREATERGMNLAAHPEDRELRRQTLAAMRAADRLAWEMVTGGAAELQK